MMDTRTLLKKFMNNAFVNLDREIDELAEEVGDDVLEEAMNVHEEGACWVNIYLCEFDMIRTTPKDSDIRWVSGHARNLFSSIKRTALEMKADKDKEGKE